MTCQVKNILIMATHRFNRGSYTVIQSCHSNKNDEVRKYLINKENNLLAILEITDHIIFLTCDKLKLFLKKIN
uniref:RadC domain-containing protein n=1 Tax=Strongyloides papillosus TaxID=174720 RepID=A0A0N5BWY9_STREA